MRIDNVTNHEIKKLLNEYSCILKKLKAKTVVKTSNSPVGDYTEWLVSKLFPGSKPEPPSTKGYDLIFEDIRYQIKGRWLKPKQSTKQLSIIRNLYADPKGFDFLIGVLFNQDFSIQGAWKIPHECLTISGNAKESTSQGGHIVHLKEPLISCKGVKEITKCLQAIK